MRRALSGLSVVELPSGIAGAYCGKLFADLGADVVKIEPPQGDGLRAATDASGAGRRGLATHLHTNKQSVVLDPALDRARGADLVERADLVIEASGHGRLADWGWNWDSLHSQCPSVSVVHVSGFGASGPYASYRWDDLVVQAASRSVLVRADQDPLRLPAHLALYFVGSMAAVGGLAAAGVAGAGGGGSFVDCSAVEALATIPFRQAELLGYQYRGCTPLPLDRPSSDTLIPIGVFPCADGFAALMSTSQQLQEMLDVLDDPGAREAFQRPDAFERPETKEVLDVAVYTWLASHTRAEATAEAQSAGWPLAGVNTAAEVLEADHLHQRNFWVHTDDPLLGSLDLPGPWCRFSEGGWALRRLAPSLGQDSGEVNYDAGAKPAAAQALGFPPPVPARTPLEGVRIVDLTTVWAGPYATMLLADLGAEVIRVENPFILPPTTKGYHPRPVLINPGYLGSLYGPSRPGAPDRPWNRHAMNNSIARNKLSVTIDTRRQDGRELLMRLAEHSDVFVDNFKASGLQRMGVDVSEMQRRNPSLVVVRMPPTGLTGDWSGYTGFGAQFDALTGLLSICGHLGSDPSSTPATTYMDAATGPAAALAVMAALRYRSATGRGQFVELAQSENVLNHLGDVFVDQQLGVEPRRVGNRDPGRAPQGLYRCRGEERWIAVSVGDDDTWRALAEVIGPPDLAADPRFAGVSGRAEHHDELDEVISRWAASRDSVEAFHTLQAAGVPAAPLFDDQLLFDDPNLRARDWFQPLESGDVGVHLHPGFAFTGVPQAWRRGSPTLGEDNEYVYKKILGVSDEDYKRYEDSRMLATDYLKADGTPY